MPDRDAIDAVIATGDQAQHGTGDHPEAVEIVAALVLLSAVRLNLDQTEARLLDTAQASGMGFEQIAAVLNISVESAEERHRQLKPRLDEPTTAPLLPQAGRVSTRNTVPYRPRRPARGQPTWNELDDEVWER